MRIAIGNSIDQTGASDSDATLNTFENYHVVEYLLIPGFKSLSFCQLSNISAGFKSHHSVN